MYPSSEKKIVRQAIDLGNDFDEAVLDIGDVKLTISKNGTIVLQANDDVRVVTEGNVDATSLNRTVNVRSKYDPMVCKKSGDVNNVGLIYLGYNPHEDYEFYMAPTELIQYMPWDEAQDYLDKIEIKGWHNFRLATHEEVDVLLNHGISKAFNAIQDKREELITPSGFLEHPGWTNSNLWVGGELPHVVKSGEIRNFEQSQFMKGTLPKDRSAWVIPVASSYKF